MLTRSDTLEPIGRSLMGEIREWRRLGVGSQPGQPVRKITCTPVDETVILLAKQVTLMGLLVLIEIFRECRFRFHL